LADDLVALLKCDNQNYLVLVVSNREVDMSSTMTILLVRKEMIKMGESIIG
jgi:hypothetical protein